MSVSRGHRSGIKEQDAEVVHLSLVSNLHGTVTDVQASTEGITAEVCTEDGTNYRVTIDPKTTELVYLDEERSFGGALDDGDTRLEYYHLVIERSLAAVCTAGHPCGAGGADSKHLG